MVRWNEIIMGAMDAATAAQTRRDLLTYCGRIRGNGRDLARIGAISVVAGSGLRKD